MMKNIAKEQVLSLKDEIAIASGQVISKTLSQNEAVSLTLFAFGKGEEISTHASSGDAVVSVLCGEAQITIDGIDYHLKENETIIMPAKKPHAVFAQEDFKMLLTVIF